MEYQQFEHVKALITEASASQTLDLERLIDVIISRQTAEIALVRRTDATLAVRTCPHCTSNNVVLHGKDENRRQRFRCRACRRTYNILTGTHMARARKPELWGAYLGHMTDYLSVRKIVATGIDINHVTSGAGGTASSTPPRMTTRRFCPA